MSWLIIFFAVIILRTLLERVFQPRDAEPRSEKQGLISLLLLTLPYFLLLLAVVMRLWPGGPLSNALFVAGLALMIIGITVRCLALRQIGRSYSMYIHPAQHSGLCVTGPYRWLRHPLYASYLLETLGLVLIASHWSALLTWGLILAATLWRVKAEEHLLLQRYGRQFRQYQQRSWRLIPGLY